MKKHLSITTALCSIFSVNFAFAAEPPQDSGQEPLPEPRTEPAPALLPQPTTASVAKASEPEPLAPLAPPTPFPVVATEEDMLEPPLAGWHGNFFLRDANDYFRLYPMGRLHMDFHNFFGSGVSDIPATDGGNALKSRLFLRRLRLEMGGEFLKRWTFSFSGEFGGQGLTNANGKTEQYAATAGTTPTSDTSRYNPPQSVGASAVLADNWVNYEVFPFLQFMIGQYNAPFTMENRTSDNTTPFMERNIAIRGFAMPANKEIGITAWGEFANRRLCYEIGAFGGDGQNRAQVDNHADWYGRIFARPFSPDSLLEKAHIGISAHHGERDPNYVGYNYSPITTAQGYALWDSKYKDSNGRLTHILPSGSQDAIGGEIRLPISRLEFRSEAYYVSNGTREAIDGYQLTNTERLGNMEGIGWYMQLSAWPLGDAFVNGDPGFVRPVKIDFAKDPGKPKKGLELLFLIAGIDATYDGASREGEYDAKTPGAEGGPGTDISILQYGIGANYWHTKLVRTSVNYNIYQTPDSGTTRNLAVVPGNTLKDPDTNTHSLHELSMRVAITF